MQNNPNLQPPPTDPLQQPTYLSQPPTQPQASPMHATRISATHGRPRVGGPISDFYGKYSTPHNQDAAGGETWIISPSLEMPYRFLCNDVQREGVKARSGLASGPFCYVPLHNI
jgi:hypothetical protein